MGLRGKLEFVAASDVGRKRTHNEDSVGTEPSLGLAVLADGMGGYKAGEVASAIAVNVILDELRKSLAHRSPAEVDEASGYSVGSLLARDAVLRANETVFQTARSQPQYQGMGTTVVVALFYDDRVSIVHVGDSRLYRLRLGELDQVTVDHSLLQELVDKGFYTLEEARQSVQKNLVTRAIGVEAEVQAEVQEEPVASGDIFVICSDGLHDLVDEQDIRLTLTETGATLELAAQRLIELANDRGGTDNISVILVRALKPFPARGRAPWYAKMLDWFN